VSSRLAGELFARLFRKIGTHGGMRKDPDAPLRDPASMPQIAGIIAVAVLLTNVAFYFLSNLYFEDRAAIYGTVTPEHVSGVRIAFGLFTGSVGAAAIFAAWQPMFVGHVIAAFTSVAALIGGVAAIRPNITPVLPAALIVASIILGLLIWKSLDRSRSAWSFLVGMTSILAAVLLFGSTKVRGVLDIGLWTALIIPGMLAVATVALTLVRSEYRDA
jgi:hypothetical protein